MVKQHRGLLFPQNEKAGGAIPGEGGLRTLLGGDCDRVISRKVAA